uniref:M13 n=1 Tax=Cherax quadricarinatus TaxID=27406 RepID=A0A0G2YL36_CHEQU|nr:M13 [Cherax quadricarinatus]
MDQSTSRSRCPITSTTVYKTATRAPTSTVANKGWTTQLTLTEVTLPRSAMPVRLITLSITDPPSPFSTRATDTEATTDDSDIEPD